MKIVFVADPLVNFDPYAETTSFLIHELCRRQALCYHVELKDLYAINHQLFAQAKEIVVKNIQNKFVYTITKNTNINLAKMDAVFLRKDPPVDLSFIDHLSLFELIANQTLVINNPSGVKFANEKLFTLYFPEFIAKTIVSQNRELIAEFVKKQNVAILKPLNLSGGRGIIRVEAKDPSLNSIIDVLTEYQSRFIMAQEFLPAVSKGDKRILLLDGQILGSFTRVPSKKDFRGNLHSGATLIKSKVTKTDLSIVNSITPRLKELGLYFVGIDVLGDKVTEINSTSPMGIREINHNDNSYIEKVMIDWLQAKIKARKNP